LQGPEKLWEALARARIVADPRKFRDYVLVPGHFSGKSHVFLQTLGYRPRSNADAWELAREFEEQAQERVATGAVQFAGTISYGFAVLL
jgi:glyoxylase-like metal-dependent hydrolase (beta-lactamase superfamily II)